MESFPLLRRIATDWWTLVLRGFLAIVFGVLAIVNPFVAGLALVTVFGVYALLDGAVAIAGGVRRKHWWGLVHGLVAVLAGIAAFVEPIVAALAITTFIGVFAILQGIVQIVVAWRVREEIEGEGWIMLGGLAAIVFGGLILARPILGGISIVLMVGAWAIVIGTALVVGGLRLRTLPQKLDALARRPAPDHPPREVHV